MRLGYAFVMNIIISIIINIIINIIIWGKVHKVGWCMAWYNRVLEIEAIINNVACPGAISKSVLGVCFL